MAELTDEAVKALLADYSMPDPPSKAHAIFRAGPALARALLDARAELARLRAMLTPPDDLRTYTVDYLVHNDDHGLPGDAPMVPADMVNRLRAESDAFRMCVNCGLIVPASHDRAQPGPGCAAPDACTFDLTPREACDHWRAKAHKYQADAQAAVALALEAAADSLLECSVWCDSQERTDDGWRNGVTDARKHGMAAIRALAPADGLAAVEALRGEARESAMQALASMGQAQEAYEAQLKAEAELAAARKEKP